MESTTQPMDVDLPDIEKYEGRTWNKIDDYLYLGSIIGARLARPDLFQVVLSIIDIPMKGYHNEGVEYCQIVADDVDDFDLLTYFPMTNKLISTWIHDKRPVLVHCAVGMSRSATIVIAYVMSRYKLSAEEGFKFVRQRRSCVRPNDGFCQQLKIFEEMGYTLNANHRQFRNFLNKTYLGFRNKNGLRYPMIEKYFDRLTLAEEMTENLITGQDICCSKCRRIVFNAMAIIVNTVSTKSSTEEPLNCSDLFIEPQKWMTEAIKKSIDDSKPWGVQYRIECPGCGQGLVTFNTLLRPYDRKCRCAAHRGLDKIMKFKVIAGSVKECDPKVP